MQKKIKSKVSECKVAYKHKLEGVFKEDAKSMAGVATNNYRIA